VIHNTPSQTKFRTNN